MKMSTFIRLDATSSVATVFSIVPSARAPVRRTADKRRSLLPSATLSLSRTTLVQADRPRRVRAVGRPIALCALLRHGLRSAHDSNDSTAKRASRKMWKNALLAAERCAARSNAHAHICAKREKRVFGRNLSDAAHGFPLFFFAVRLCGVVAIFRARSRFLAPSGAPRPSIETPVQHSFPIQSTSSD